MSKDKQSIGGALEYMFNGLLVLLVIFIWMGAYIFSDKIENEKVKDKIELIQNQQKLDSLKQTLNYE